MEKKIDLNETMKTIEGALSVHKDIEYQCRIIELGAPKGVDKAEKLQIRQFVEDDRRSAFVTVQALYVETKDDEFTFMSITDLEGGTYRSTETYSQEQLVSTLTDMAHRSKWEVRQAPEDQVRGDYLENKCSTKMRAPTQG